MVLAVRRAEYESGWGGVSGQVYRQLKSLRRGVRSQDVAKVIGVRPAHVLVALSRLHHEGLITPIAMIAGESTFLYLWLESGTHPITPLKLRRTLSRLMRLASKGRRGGSAIQMSKSLAELERELKDIRENLQ